MVTLAESCPVFTPKTNTTISPLTDRERDGICPLALAANPKLKKKSPEKNRKANGLFNYSPANCFQDIS
jgi:hypothetical protein